MSTNNDGMDPDWKPDSSDSKSAAIERLTKENVELKRKLEIATNALISGAEYARCDDVNGDAGEICEKALKEIGE